MEYLSHAFRHAFVWEFWTWIICGIFGVFETCGVVNKLTTCWCRSAGTRTGAGAVTCIGEVTCTGAGADPVTCKGTAATLGIATGFWWFPEYSIKQSNLSFF